MRVYVSYSHKDEDFVDRWADFMEEGLRTSQALVVVLSKASVVSEWVSSEFTSFALHEDTSHKRIVPVLMEDCQIPSFLADRFYADFRESFERGLQALSEGLEAIVGGLDAVPVAAEAEAPPTWRDDLQEAFRKGNRGLFVGAGVSADAGLAQWSQLLNNLLRDMFQRRGPGSDEAPEQLERLATLFQERLGLSSLITGRYLKDTLRESFNERVRKALYEKEPGASEQIQAIVELCRPRRSGAVLHSIVTFNFDDLLERFLAEQHVPFDSIHEEGQRSATERIPIYHVHGFLPHDGQQDDSQIIFSEDAYHSQFIEPFSWSNLTQLAALTQNTCLLVGLSLMDPNLRRLLDVAMRKNPEGALHHYIVRRRHDEKSLLNDVEDPSDEERKLLHTLRRRAHVLEEQDANSLGLKMIWVDEFDEIPGILRGIVTDR
jgi:hypothetical protein